MTEYAEIKAETPGWVQSAAFNTQWTYSLVDHAPYYANVAPAYYDFMTRWVRHWLWWYDGYVPYMHSAENGIFSTRIATALTDRTAKKVIGGRIMYKNVGRDASGDGKLNAALRYISGTWSKATDFAKVIKRVARYSAAGGTALLKLNRDQGGLWCEALRFDHFIPSVDFRGKLTEVSCFLMGQTKLNAAGKTENYYLLERRYYGAYRRVTGEVLQNVPLAEYVIKRSSGTATTGKNYSQQSERIEFRSLPKDVRKGILENYSVLEFDAPILLPFGESLGAELVTWTDGVSNVPQLPFGESLLSNIVSELMSWDYYYSAFNTDMYLGRGRVLMPRGATKAGSTNYNSGVDSFLFTKMEYADPEGQKPTPLQFDLRSTGWREIRDTLIQNIALKTGMNISTIASFLVDNNEAKTAREISTEENETAGFVDDKRELLETPINRILKLVLRTKGYTDDVVIRWSGAGLTNRHSLAEILNMGLAGGFISRQKAVQMFNYDDDDEKVQQEYDLIVRDAATGQADYNESDYYGAEVANGTEQPAGGNGIGGRGNADTPNDTG